MTAWLYKDIDFAVALSWKTDEWSKPESDIKPGLQFLYESV